MQHPVHDIADQFALPGGVEAVSLTQRFVKADKDLPVQTALSKWLRVVEGDHVGRAFVLEKGLIETGHLGRGDEVNTQIKALDAWRVSEQRLHYSTQQAHVDSASAVAVAKGESAAQAASLGGWGRVWPRWSS